MLQRNLLLTALMGSLFACGTPSGSGVLLTGGEAVPEERYYPATVFFARSNGDGTATNKCTGVKLTARQILTAAHCVFDLGNNRFEVSPGNELWLYSGNDLTQLRANENAWPFQVAAVDIHPQYVSQTFHFPDLAVVTMTSDILKIPRGILATAEPLPGTEVVKVGYGCEQGYGTGGGGTRLKFAFDSILGTPELQAAYLTGGDAYPTDAMPEALAIGMFTRGVRAGGRSGLCHGDSGGPLYLKAGGGLTVVGVNAQSFNSNGTHAIVDYHASVVKAAGWLASVLHF